MLASSIHEAARQLGVTRSFVRRLIAAGVLPSPTPPSLRRRTSPVAVDLGAAGRRVLELLAADLRRQASAASERSLPPVSTHSDWGGGGVEHEARAIGRGPARIETEKRKYGYVPELKGKTGRRKRAPQNHPYAEKVEGQGPKGGRPRHSKKLHPVIEDILDGRI